MIDHIHIYTRYWVTWKALRLGNRQSRMFAQDELEAARAFAREKAENPNLEVRLLMETEHEIPRS